MRMHKALRAILLNIALLLSFLFSSNIYAENSDSRLYKISVLVFKHLPEGKNTSPRLTYLWTEKKFLESISTNSLRGTSSALSGASYTLSHDKNYSILYNSAWISSLQNEKPTTLHFHEAFNDSPNILDGLIKITLHYNLDVHFQTQWLNENKMIALDEAYQTPSNELHYIDGPIYGALVLITRYVGPSSPHTAEPIPGAKKFSTKIKQPDQHLF